MNPSPPILVVLAGPNGSGKSSFYEWHLAEFELPFINADRISLEVFGNHEPSTASLAAGLAELRRRELLEARRSFIFETVLSDPVGAKVAFCAEARAASYHVEVHFIGIASPALSLARVIHRVANGGHDVPDDRIHARYPRVMENLRRLIPVASRLTVYDNSEIDRAHRPVAVFEDGVPVALSAELPAWLGFLDLRSLETPATISLP